MYLINGLKFAGDIIKCVTLQAAKVDFTSFNEILWALKKKLSAGRLPKEFPNNL